MYSPILHGLVVFVCIFKAIFKEGQQKKQIKKARKRQLYVHEQSVLGRKIIQVDQLISWLISLRLLTVCGLAHSPRVGQLGK